MTYEAVRFVVVTKLATYGRAVVCGLSDVMVRRLRADGFSAVKTRIGVQVSW